MRKHYSSGTKWEPIVGYSRAVRQGSLIWISGTTASDSQGNIIGRNEPYLQTVRAIQNIEIALRKLGSCLDDVVRTRIYVKDIKHWENIAKAHREYFGEVKPCTSMIEVSKFIDSEILVEIEADAVAVEKNELLSDAI